MVSYLKHATCFLKPLVWWVLLISVSLCIFSSWHFWYLDKSNILNLVVSWSLFFYMCLFIWDNHIHLVPLNAFLNVLFVIGTAIGSIHFSVQLFLSLFSMCCAIWMCYSIRIYFYHNCILKASALMQCTLNMCVLVGLPLVWWPHTH